MNDNLKVWNAVKQVPNNFLKPITSGALKGKSDINPQWRLMAMTQAFGVVGHGWTYRVVKTWSEQSTALSKDKQSQDPTIMVFVEVAVKTKLNGEWGEEFSGIGGSQIVQQFNSYAQANDEGYKMALTDALSVAFKAVGIAADVYLGNFDGSKYKFDLSQAYQEQIEQSPVGNAAMQQGAQIGAVRQKPSIDDVAFQRAIANIKTGGKDKNNVPITKKYIEDRFTLTLDQQAELAAMVA